MDNKRTNAQELPWAHQTQIHHEIYLIQQISHTETYNNIVHASSLFPPIESKYIIAFFRKSTTWERVSQWKNCNINPNTVISRLIIILIKTYREAPVYPQVDRNQQDVFRKDVHLFGPAADSGVATAAQLGIEEGVERIDWWQVGVLAALNQQIHVKVDHLRDYRERDWLSIAWTSSTV